MSSLIPAIRDRQAVANSRKPTSGWRLRHSPHHRTCVPGSWLQNHERPSSLGVHCRGWRKACGLGEGCGADMQTCVQPPWRSGSGYPPRPPTFPNRPACDDQLRTVDVERLVKRLGRLRPETVTTVLRGLQDMFVE